jgi:hypothetical protein
LTINSNWIGEKIWVFNARKKFRNPLVAILYEEQCETVVRGHPATNFLAYDWNNALRRLGIATEKITIDQLTDKVKQQNRKLYIIQ